MHVAPVAQAFPQAPQFLPSYVVFVHASAQIAVAQEGHSHTPRLHTLVGPQTLPQVPQFVMSRCRSTQIPPQTVAVPAQ